jgi:hypothetical protein
MIINFRTFDVENQLRIKVKQGIVMREWLKEIHEKYVGIRQYEYTPANKDINVE